MKKQPLFWYFGQLKNRSLAGFTLIELMITVSIMMLMLGGGIAAYLRFNERQALIGDVKTVQVLLRSAQKKSRVGDKPASCDHLLGYAVKLFDNQNQVQLLSYCQNGQQVRDTIYLSKALPQQDAEVLFKVLHGGVDFLTGDGQLVFTTDRYQYGLSVSSGGSISEMEVSKL